MTLEQHDLDMTRAANREATRATHLKQLLVQLIIVAVIAVLAAFAAGAFAGYEFELHNIQQCTQSLNC